MVGRKFQYILSFGLNTMEKRYLSRQNLYVSNKMTQIWACFKTTENLASLRLMPEGFGKDGKS